SESRPCSISTLPLSKMTRWPFSLHVAAAFAVRTMGLESPGMLRVSRRISWPTTRLPVRPAKSRVRVNTSRPVVVCLDTLPPAKCCMVEAPRQPDRPRTCRDERSNRRDSGAAHSGIWLNVRAADYKRDRFAVKLNVEAAAPCPLAQVASLGG